jgi:hypothetical protein
VAFQEVKREGGGGGTFFKWDAIGKSVEGRYLGVFDGKILSGRQTKYAKFVQSNGVELKVNVTAVLLDRFTERGKNGELRISPGDVLRVTYTHDEKGSQPMPAKIFKIEKEQATTSAAPVPDAAAIEAAKALLASLNPTPAVVPASGTSVGAPTTTAPVSEYDRLIAVLTASNPKGAAAIKGALEQLYPDESTRLTKLQETLKQQGIAS